MNSNPININRTDTKRPPIKLLFVCLGNICRSPAAEGIFRHLVDIRSAPLQFHIDSAGTADYHIGKPPDPRTIAALSKQGLDVSRLRCRQIGMDDFEQFDFIFVMDSRNRDALMDICPAHQQYRIHQIVDFIDDQTLSSIPDPFHGSEQDFDDMVNLLFPVCTAVLEKIIQDSL